jgi:hypothetical protein
MMIMIVTITVTENDNDVKKYGKKFGHLLSKS